MGVAFLSHKAAFLQRCPLDPCHTELGNLFAWFIDKSSRNPVQRGVDMLFLMNHGEKKGKRRDSAQSEEMARIKELFTTGRFPVVTTQNIEGKFVEKVLGLVACRGYDSEEAFFGMTARAINKGAQAIIGYQENVAFHPDGSKFFSCYGTAVQFESAKKTMQRRLSKTA